MTNTVEITSLHADMNSITMLSFKLSSFWGRKKKTKIWFTFSGGCDSTNLKLISKK